MAGSGAALPRANSALAIAQTLTNNLAARVPGADGAAHVASNDTVGGTLWNSVNGFIAALLGGQVTPSLPTRAQMLANKVPAAITTITTCGFAAANDGGGARYARVSGPLADGSSFQSADGAWWQLQGAEVCPEMFGAKGDGATNDYTALQNAINFVSSAASWAGKVVLQPCRSYNTASQLLISGQVGLVLTSEGCSGRIVGTSAIATGTAIILVQNCWKCEISVNLAGNSTTLPNGIEFRNTGTNTWIGAPMSECVVRNCTFGLGVVSAQMTIGIRITDTRASNGTNDGNSEHKFQNVQFTQFIKAGISIESLNSLQHDFDRCEFTNFYSWPSNCHAIQTVSVIATSGANTGSERGGGGFVARHCLLEPGGGLNAPVYGQNNCLFYLRGALLHDIQIIGCESEDNSTLLDADLSTWSSGGVANINFTSCGFIGGVGEAATTAGAFVAGNVYQITTVGSTSFTAIGAASNTVGTVFTATGSGSGTGTASHFTPYISANTNTSRLVISCVNVSANVGRASAAINLASNNVTMNWVGGLFTATNVVGNGNLNISAAASVVGNNVCNFSSNISLTCYMFNNTFQVGGVPGFSGLPFYVSQAATFGNSVKISGPGNTLSLTDTSGASVSLQAQPNATAEVIYCNGYPMLSCDGRSYTAASAGTATLPANPAGFVKVPVLGGFVKMPYYNS